MCGCYGGQVCSFSCCFPNIRTCDRFSCASRGLGMYSPAWMLQAQQPNELFKKPKHRFLFFPFFFPFLPWQDDIVFSHAAVAERYDVGPRFAWALREFNAPSSSMLCACMAIHKNPWAQPVFAPWSTDWLSAVICVYACMSCFRSWLSAALGLLCMCACMRVLCQP